MDVDLSIIIPVFNKWNFTKNCLDDLFQLGPNHEIIVVDDCSSDEETQEELKKLNRPNFKVIRNSVNSGFAKSCNAAYKIARGTNVMFLNNDIRVQSNHTNWTDILIKTLSKDNEDYNEYLVGPTGCYMNLLTNHFVYETTLLTKNINYMSGWCLSARKETFNKLIKGNSKPFSEDFFAYYEDCLLSMEANKLGIKFKLIEIPVVHFGKITSSQLNTNKLYNESRRIFIEKMKDK